MAFTRVAGLILIFCLYCTRGNMGAQVFGDGSSQSRDRPVKIRDGIASISSGSFHIGLIDSSGNLWMAGANENGQLGLGDFKSSNVPIKALAKVKMVRCGNSHTLALLTDGRLFAAGSAANGELGTSDVGIDTADGGKSLPSFTFVFDGVSSIAAGIGFSFAIKTDGSLWAFGLNNGGELGDGTKENKHKPIRIMEQVTKVVTGDEHTLILKRDGTLWACGRNDFGQLGGGGHLYELKPIKTLKGVVDIAAGSNSSFAVTQDGLLWACGANSNGQLGDGTIIDKFSWVQVWKGAMEVSVGQFHTMILNRDGNLFACGGNGEHYFGQMGVAYLSSSKTPTKVMEDVSMVSAGALHTIVLKKDASLWAFGFNGTIDDRPGL